MTFWEHCEKIFWRLITPIFPFLRDTALTLGIVKHKGRQACHIGWLRPGKDPQTFKDYLITQGFEECTIAWIDEGEMFNLRRRRSFKYQFHVRLFTDREVCVHDELTPEYSPLDHLHDTETVCWIPEDLAVLGDWVDQSSMVSADLGNMRSNKDPATSRDVPTKG